VSELHVDAEVVAEEDAGPAEATDPVRPLPAGYEPQGASALPALRPEVKTAVLATAGGVLAGAATVAAVRAVTGAAARARSPRRLAGRRREQNVVASRSFLVDVHLLGR
jgi:hypothetical protein